MIKGKACNPNRWPECVFNMICRVDGEKSTWFCKQSAISLMYDLLKFLEKR